MMYVGKVAKPMARPNIAAGAKALRDKEIATPARNWPIILPVSQHEHVANVVDRQCAAQCNLALKVGFISSLKLMPLL
jgi:hypothetical protein